MKDELTIVAGDQSSSALMSVQGVSTPSAAAGSGRPKTKEHAQAVQQQVRQILAATKLAKLTDEDGDDSMSADEKREHKHGETGVCWRSSHIVARCRLRSARPVRFERSC